MFELLANESDKKGEKTEYLIIKMNGTLIQQHTLMKLQTMHTVY